MVSRCRRQWWSGVVRRGLVLGLTATSVSAAGCGGRTSSLESEAYEVDVGGATAGNASLGGGAASSGGFGAVGATGSVEPPPEDDACQRYCSGYGSQCAARLPGQDCSANCRQEVTSAGSDCEKLGLAALTCLTPYFRAGGGSCDAAEARALGQCGELVNAFRTCKSRTSPPSTPAPPGPAMPTPRLDVTTCSSGGETMGGDANGASTCSAIYRCATADFFVGCAFEQDMARCLCTVADGTLRGSGTFAISRLTCSVAAKALCN